jgi:hypothetical protein
MAWKVVGTYDPKSGKTTPLSTVTIQTPVQQKQQTESDSSKFNIDKFAAESAASQMNWAANKGANVTMEDFENARKAAWQSASEFQKQYQMEAIRNQSELQRQIAMKNYDETMVKRMTPEQLKDASGLMTAPDAIMQLYNLHQDANNVPGYGKAIIGPATNPLYNATDPRVRVYNSAREGAMVSLARGLMEDTGQVAGKESSQAQMREMMPNDADDRTMGGIKTVSMLQTTLEKMGQRIRGLRSDNYDAGPLQDVYTRTYNQYKGLVEIVGTQAQQQHPAASPDEIFGGQQQQFQTQGPQPIQPVVKAGVSTQSQSTIDSVNAAAAGQTAQQPQNVPMSNVEGPFTLPQETPAPQTQQDTRAQHMQQAQQIPGQVAGAVSGAVGKGVNWLQSLLPENWDPSSFDQPRNLQ